ncbi:MAG TPA: hypothetical protein DHW82_06970 [Spirochaetia bacterium]|nr:MAG: hypothetical protein A2Y41_11815 [Spirochaetes bacterium GWB1_36_13]HCL56735.1 hypothetical protein [Spirochaetia bacterium]
MKIDKIKNGLFSIFSEKYINIPPRYKIIILWALLLAVLPFFSKFSTVELFLFGNIYLMYATSWDILSGYTGQESFGHSLFIGISGYLAGFLSYRLAEMGILDIHLPFGVNMIIGAVVAGLFGLIIGIPSLKLKGPFLALATLSSASLATELVKFFNEYTNGEEGLSRISSVSSISGVKAYYLSIVLLFVCLGITYFISRSKYGTLLKAIREDDAAAQAVGINTMKFRIGAFVLSSALAGLAGCFHAYYLGGVSPTLVETSLSLEIITFVVVGGIGTITGSIGGVYFLLLTSQILRGFFPEFKVMIYMILMVVVMLFLPKGLWSYITEKTVSSYQKWKRQGGNNGKNT